MAEQQFISKIKYSNIDYFIKASKIANSLTIQLNGDETKVTFDGSEAKTINITASSIGAASSSLVNTVSTLNNSLTEVKNIVDTASSRIALKRATGNKSDYIDGNSGLNDSDESCTYTLPGKSGQLAVMDDIPDIPTSLPASDVYAWAKAATKPTYQWSEITNKPTSFTPAAHTHNDYITSEHLGQNYYTKTHIDDNFAKVSHTHGNITSKGELDTASRIVVTDASKKITTGTIDPASIVLTNDSRLSDARTPTEHTQAGTTITGPTASAQGDRYILTNTGDGAESTWMDDSIYARANQIPAVNNATLTIQKNNVNVATFTANSATNTTANIAVPTKVSDLSDASDYVKKSDKPTSSTPGPVYMTFSNGILTISDEQIS